MKLYQEIALADSGILPPLISDYLAEKPGLKRLYKYPPAFSSFSDIISDKSKEKTDRNLLVDVLKEQYAGIPTTSLVHQNINSLLSEKTFAVVASHQPSLLLGPLYNIYKIAGAINLSAQLKKAFPAYNFVPVFWMGSEDHDIEELNHTFINGKKIEWQNAGNGAIGRLKTSSLLPVIEQLKGIQANNEVVHLLEDGLRKYPTFGQLTQYFVNDLFKESGLVVVDQDNAKLKRRFAGVIKDEITKFATGALLKPNLDFLENNYKAQAKPRDINFFYLGEGFRERVVLNEAGNKYEINNTRLSFTREEIIEEIDKHPERFSPNVIFRPLYQEMILPNLAFIGGSGELSYWIELKPLFEHYKVNYPMLVLRNSAAIINSSVQKKMEKLGLITADFFMDTDKLINKYVKDNMPVEAHLNGERKRLEEIFEEITQKAAAADTTLKQNVAAEKQKALASLDNIESKMLKAEKRKQETAVNQITAIKSALFPENVPQERTENFTSFYSPDFVESMVNQLDPFKKSFETYLAD